MLWSSVEMVFPNKSHIEDENESRILFMTDKDYRMYGKEILWDESDEDYDIWYHKLTSSLFFFLDNSITPLRIKYSSRVYTVVLKEKSSSGLYDTFSGTRPFSPVYDQPSTESPSLHSPSQSYDLFFSVPSTSSTNVAYNNILGWYHMYSGLFPILEQNRTLDRHYFLIVLANLDHQHLVVEEAISKFTTADPVEKEGVASMRQGLSEMFKHVEQCELVNRMYGALRNFNQCVEFAAPRLFIVLPEDLDHWNNLDPRTHKFRLYFICDFNYNKAFSDSGRYIFDRNQVRHLHIVSHPGYVIKHPIKFFRQFGLYALTMLQMVKFGLLERDFFVPDLSTFRILSCCTTRPRHSLKQGSIAHLIDMSISYIKGLQPRFRVSKTWLDGPDTQQIQTHLKIPPDDNGMGGMYRSAYKRYGLWMCADHSTEQRDTHDLEEFIDTHGGHLSVEHNQVKVELTSVEQATELCTILRATGHVFDVSLELTWPASRTELREILRRIGNVGTVVLEVDGVTFDTHPQSPFRYGVDIFAQLIGSNGVKFIALNNYPRRSEQYVYLGECGFYLYGFHFVRKSRRSDFAWLELRKTLDLVMEKLTSKDVKDNDIGLSEFKKVFAEYEGSDLKSVDIYDTDNSTMWQGSFKVKHNTVTGLRDAIHPSILPKRILENGTIRRLLVRSEALYDQSVLRRLMDANQQLQKIDLQVPENRVLTLVSSHIGKRLDNLHPLHITIFEMQSELEGRDVASFLVKHPGDQESGDNLAHNPDQSQSVVTLEDIKVLSWSCDTVSGALSNKTAALLGLATLQDQLALTRFTLDVTFLTAEGLGDIKRVLKRSALECLHIRCVPIRSRLRKHVAMVLGAVQWLTIKTLILSGDNVDHWLQLWINEGSLLATSGKHQGPRLMCLEVFDNGVSEHFISHAGALALHHVVYSCQLSVLTLENVRLQDDRDWDLIIGALDITVLEELSLCWSDIVGVDRIKELLAGGGQARSGAPAPEQYATTAPSDLRATLGMAKWLKPEPSTDSTPLLSDPQSEQDSSEEDSTLNSPGDESEFIQSTSVCTGLPHQDASWGFHQQESFLWAPMDPNWNAPGDTPIAFSHLPATGGGNWVLPPEVPIDGPPPPPFINQDWAGHSGVMSPTGPRLLSPQMGVPLRRQPSTGPPEAVGSRPRRVLSPQWVGPAMDQMSAPSVNMQWVDTMGYEYQRPSLVQQQLWPLVEQQMSPMEPPPPRRVSGPQSGALMMDMFSSPLLEQQWVGPMQQQWLGQMEQQLVGLPGDQQWAGAFMGGQPWTGPLLEQPWPGTAVMEEMPGPPVEQLSPPPMPTTHVPMAYYTHPTYYTLPQLHIHAAPEQPLQTNKPKKKPRPSKSKGCSVM